jgi:hypothetical protein
VAIADVDEQQRAQVADAVDPPEKDGRLADVGAAEGTAGMRAGERTKLL